MDVEYTYDDTGLRLTKTVNGEKYTYLYEGGLLVQETRGTKVFNYSYDANGELTMLKYQSKPTSSIHTAYYALNSRGDVIGLYNASGELIAKYTYDVWGNVLSITDASGDVVGETALANIQPFRYRSYYYDSDSSLYYLQSRYYDPVTHRFINADGLVSTGTGVLGHNMFAYCENNPVNCNDSLGLAKTSSFFKGITKALRVSIMMLKHAFKGKGKSQSYGPSSCVSKALSKSVIMQGVIDKNIEEFKKNNKTKATYDGSVSLYGKDNMYDVDLSYSVGKASYNMTISQETKTTGFWFLKKTKTRYVVDVFVSDRYDFDEYRDNATLGSILNNWGYDKQQEGSLVPFEWDASFTYYSEWS